MAKAGYLTEAGPVVVLILVIPLDEGKSAPGMSLTFCCRCWMMTFDRRAGENGRLPQYAVVIMTSNLGLRPYSGNALGYWDYGHMKEMVLGVVSQKLPSRVYQTVLTKWLSSPSAGEKHIASIAQIQLQWL